MDTSSVSLIVAFAAGMVSFLSPCVLPVVPSYLTFITGMSLDELTVQDASRAAVRRAVLAHGSLFVAGFSAFNIILGASATFLGSLFFYVEPALGRIGGLLLIVFGLYLLGVLRLPSLNREWRVHLADKPLGYLGTAIVGVTFGAAWRPCNGPILGSILMLAGTRGSVPEGMGLLLIYSLGLAVPFLLAAFFLQGVVGGMRHIGPWLLWMNWLSGIVLLLLGLLMITGSFTVLTALLAEYTPAFLQERI
jgi:cytochrome c-type biogenesis protein